jgi:hypothetical protein
MKEARQMMCAIVWRRLGKHLCYFCIVACLAVPKVVMASEYRGQVLFNGLPVPGATVTASQGSKTLTASSDEDGYYSFPDLSDGPWKITLTMTGFAMSEQDVIITSNAPPIKWELKMLSLDAIIAQAKAIKAVPVHVAAAEAQSAPTKSESPKAAEAVEMPKPADESAPQSSDGFLVNGSVNNAATSRFTMAPAFGNSRKGTKSLYTGGLALVIDNSALDARPYSLTGQNTPKSAYNRVTGVATFGGPLNIPHLMPHGPNFVVNYQWIRDRIATADSGLVPTLDQRSGNLPSGTVAVSPQAVALLAVYPLPNLAGNEMYNYQVPVLSNSHADVLQTRLDKSITRRDQLYGVFAFQSIRADASNLFGFRDTTNTLGINAGINWNHRLSHSLFVNTGYRFSRLRTQVVPFFANRANISGDAGITGNNQDATNWGPTTLVFSSSIASLTDAQSSFNRNRTDAISPSVQWSRRNHNFTFGGDFRRQEFNYLSQQDPRGTFVFTGAATDTSDFADFLSGIPDTSSIAFGNADKYLRQSVYDAYFTDDWRILPELTINAGLRWEYGAPISELKDRLVNLDVAPNFTAVAPVLASNPTGLLTRQHYPASLIRPDRRAIEPRVGVSWRPVPGSSLVMRAGYGIYADTSVYQATALNLAQQSPLSKSLTVQNSAACPQTLASGFNPCSSITTNTFAVDPNFQVGYAQTWQVAVQRDLPAALQIIATYLGVKGTHGVQEFYPNTYPLGAMNPCTTCPAGFDYRASNGNSIREAGSLQLRRRLRGGFTASAQYTFSKSVDDDSVLGGQGPVAAGAVSQTPTAPQAAQNWLNLGAERGRSTFDQRHLLNTTFQYTSGMGLNGGTLLGGWRGRAVKEWTVTGQIVAGSGLPETPVYLAAVNGTGFTGSIRPDRTGIPLYAASRGRFLNSAAFAPPQPGQWGNAGRNSITGPDEFTFNASVSRTFRVGKQYNLDVRVDATNLLNHVVFTSWNNVLNPTTSGAPTFSLSSPLFGLPLNTNPMRSLQTTARLRF